MSKLIDLTGQVFEHLTVIERGKNTESGRAQWLCKCDCGNPALKEVRGKDLRNGKIKSCGRCNQYIIGQKFNHLTVLAIDYEYKEKRHIKNTSLFYKCQCDCEDKTIITVNGFKLRHGVTKSCGCYAREVSGKIHSKDISNQVFGYLKALYPTELRTNHGIVIWHCVCLRDNNECDIPLVNLTRGNTRSCGCLKSVGEANIQQLLSKNNIKFEKEKTFDDLVNLNTNYKYRYDFYLPDYNRLIEFDGEQHFKETGWDNYEEKFKRTQQSDKVKNEYALSHNIPLVRIPYWERDNITLESILGNKYLLTDLEEEIIF